MRIYTTISSTFGISSKVLLFLTYFMYILRRNPERVTFNQDMKNTAFWLYYCKVVIIRTCEMWAVRPLLVSKIFQQLKTLKRNQILSM